MRWRYTWDATARVKCYWHAPIMTISALQCFQVINVEQVDGNCCPPPSLMWLLPQWRRLPIFKEVSFWSKHNLDWLCVLKWSLCSIPAGDKAVTRWNNHRMLENKSQFLWQRWKSTDAAGVPWKGWRRFQQGHRQGPSLVCNGWWGPKSTAAPLDVSTNIYEVH